MASQEEKTSVVKSEEPSPAGEQPQPPQAAGAAQGCAGQPLRLLKHDELARCKLEAFASSYLLEDPSIKEMAEQIAKDPAFTEMAEQLQKTVVQSPRAAEMPPALDPSKYVSTCSS
ncbi:hypothetical protein GUJ93_ZPchr0003g17390 [Zizania palustris]|uniref:Uncharacterized protein n=1 Tax=Zizania palustris TaxID=103762 RepID=A0A8J5SK00_ZIZPA|nr:hypothetical protein GUJ93_ZPchr0003g17390 [Zizania palustris]